MLVFDQMKLSVKSGELLLVRKIVVHRVTESKGEAYRMEISSFLAVDRNVLYEDILDGNTSF